MRADSEDERPANMMRAVSSPLIVTGGLRLARGIAVVLVRGGVWGGGQR